MKQTERCDDQIRKKKLRKRKLLSKDEIRGKRRGTRDEERVGRSLVSVLLEGGLVL